MCVCVCLFVCLFICLFVCVTMVAAINKLPSKLNRANFYMFVLHFFIVDISTVYMEGNYRANEKL